MFRFTTYERATGIVRQQKMVSHIELVSAQIADDEGIVSGHVFGRIVDGEAVPLDTEDEPATELSELAGRDLPGPE